MLGSKNRDYKTGDRAIRANMAVHKDRMGELVASGMTEKDASVYAYGELRSGKLQDRIKAKVQELRKSRRVS